MSIERAVVVGLGTFDEWEDRGVDEGKIASGLGHCSCHDAGGSIGGPAPTISVGADVDPFLCGEEAIGKGSNPMGSAFPSTQKTPSPPPHKRKSRSADSIRAEVRSAA